MDANELRALADAVRHASYDDPFGDAELRALADALEPMSSAPRFEGMNVLAFCKWLRAQADAQPVANLYYATSPHGGRRLAIADPMSPQMGQFAVYAHPAPAAPQTDEVDLDAVAMQQMRQAAAESTWMPSEYTSNDWIDDVCRWLRDGPPAAAPQAEPIDPHMIVAEDRFPDEQAEPKVAASFYTEDAELIGTTSAPIKKVEVEDDGSIHVFIDHWPQAEPKREPNPDEVICPACTHQFRAIPENVQAQLWAKREPLTYEQLVSACYTYRHDFGLLDPDEQELVIEEAGRWAKAFGIGGSDVR